MRESVMATRGSSVLRSTMVRFIVSVALCLLSESLANVATAGEPSPKGKPDPSALRLINRIVEASRLSPLRFEQAAALLATSLGPERVITEYRSEWTLSPTEAIAEGTAMRGTGGGGVMFLSIVPKPSLDL